MRDKTQCRDGTAQERIGNEQTNRRLREVLQHRAAHQEKKQLPEDTPEPWRTVTISSSDYSHLSMRTMHTAQSRKMTV